MCDDEQVYIRGRRASGSVQCMPYSLLAMAYRVRCEFECFHRSRGGRDAEVRISNLYGVMECFQWKMSSAYVAWVRFVNWPAPSKGVAVVFCFKLVLKLMLGMPRAKWCWPFVVSIVSFAEEASCKKEFSLAEQRADYPVCYLAPCFPNLVKGSPKIAIRRC
jgi:hypothetical protein